MYERLRAYIAEKYKKIVEIEHLTPHALSNTFGHELIVNKTPLNVVARLMGHMKKDGSPNIDMVLVYTILGQEDLQRAVEGISWI